MQFVQLFKFIPESLPPYLLNHKFNHFFTHSQFLQNNDVFFAQQGENFDSHIIIPDLLAKGIWVIANSTYSLPSEYKHFQEKLITFNYTYYTLSALSRAYFDEPDSKMTVIGVTGTNGKTSTTQILYSLLSTQHKTGLIGTIHHKIGDTEIPSVNTTPDAFTLYSLLNQMVKANCAIVIMEISSHSLFLGRVALLQLDIALFTNLTSEHLDFHHNMEEYLAAKLKIFDILSTSKKQNKLAIYNINIPYYHYIQSKIQEHSLKYTTFAVTQKNSTIKANYLAYILDSSIKSTSFVLNTTESSETMKTSLTGAFNIENITGSLICLKHLKILCNSSISQNLLHLKIKGRFEDITPDKDYSIIIDYAHTPDALENVLITAKNLNPSKIILVFGCGGNRDTTKRPLMANIASKYADTIIITSDNPRKENPYQIVEHIYAGIPTEKQQNTQKIVNRKKAIQKGIIELKKNAIMIIAGKGHEEYQIFQYKTIPFSDKQVVTDYLVKG